jgi:predicted amidohydrolase YtcJ
MGRKLWDTLLVNASVRTLEREGDVQAGMAIRDGRIDAVFAEPPAPTLAREARDVVDCGGRTVLPGLIDAHMHFLAAAAFKVGAYCAWDLKPPIAGRTLRELADGLTAYASALPPGRPVLCFNYVIDAVAEKRLPSRAELDAWLPGREVVVVSMDGHSSSYSGPALERLGLTAEHPDGVLCGESHELSMGSVNGLMASSISLAMLSRGIQGVVNDALSLGLVSLHCMEGFEDSRTDPSLWLFSRCAGSLPLDIRLYIQYRDPRRVAPYRRFLRSPRIGGCLGWAFDGSICSGTAALDEPYASDAANRGRLYFSDDEAAALLRRSVDAGMQVSTHAIGGRAIETLLDAWDRVLGEAPGNPLRHRIEHFELPTRDQVQRATARGFGLVAQPGFAWLDERYIHAYRRQLSEAQYARQIPLRDLLDAGAVVAGSSDFPAGNQSPWVQMQGMVEHPLPGQSISLHEALRTYTHNAAWLTGEEGERGTLAPGKKADFIIMENDPFALPVASLHGARVRETWINGRRAAPMRMSTPGFLARAFLARRKRI